MSTAVRYLEREHFDIVVLDLLLPDAYGPEGVQQIAHAVPDVPILVLTGVVDECIASEAISEGAKDVLVKGLSVAEFRRALQGVFSDRQRKPEVFRFASGTSAMLITGDDIISGERPAEVLVVGSPESVRFVTGAVEPYADCFVLDTVHTLAEAEQKVTARTYDAVVLNPALPDTWLQDAYSKLENLVEETPVIMMGDKLPLRPNAAAPFGTIGSDRGDVLQLRRLLISAALRKRALESPLEKPPGASEALQPASDRWH